MVHRQPHPGDVTRSHERHDQAFSRRRSIYSHPVTPQIFKAIKKKLQSKQEKLKRAPNKTSTDELLLPPRRQRAWTTLSAEESDGLFLHKGCTSRHYSTSVTVPTSSHNIEPTATMPMNGQACAGHHQKLKHDVREFLPEYKRDYSYYGED